MSIGTVMIASLTLKFELCKISTMNKKMLFIFEELETKRQALSDMVDTIDNDLRTYKPDAGSWSLLQVCHHLIVSEELSLKYLNKKLLSPSTIAPAGIISSLRSLSLNLALRSPFRLTAPPRVSEFPDRLDWVELKNRWTKVRESMYERLANIPEEVENRLAYKHPSVGRLTLYQMLTFFRTHINRHENQINRLIRSGSDLKRRHH
jgi:hypothetical protein